MTEVHQPAAKRGKIGRVTGTSHESQSPDPGTYMVERKETLAQLDGDEEFVSATIDWEEVPQRSFDSAASRRRLGFEKVE